MKVEITEQEEVYISSLFDCEDEEVLLNDGTIFDKIINLKTDFSESFVSTKDELELLGRWNGLRRNR